MIYLTGDIHGDPRRVLAFAERTELRPEDAVILLGDVAANFAGGARDERVKTALSQLPCPLLCIHGNHEMRPQTLPSYREEAWMGGVCYVEERFPKLKFAKDGEIYTLEGRRCIAVGGAYSVDKPLRLEYGYGWWPDEQPSQEIRARVERTLAEREIDVVLSHTCPRRFVPRDNPPPDWLDLRTVDTGTEDWLNALEPNIRYEAWFCGHWHVDRRVGKLHFLFQTWETLEGRPCGE